jgi:hypothetical protein
MPPAAGPTAACALFSLSFPTVGLHQYPSERKGEGVAVRSLHVPSHVPGHPADRRQVRGFSSPPPGCIAERDSPLEDSGFETPVPLTTGTLFRIPCAPARGAHRSDPRGTECCPGRACRGNEKDVTGCSPASASVVARSMRMAPPCRVRSRRKACPACSADSSP